MAYKVLSDYTFTIERQTTYGAAIATAPIGLPTEDMTFTVESNKHRLNRAWGYRGQHENNSWNDTFGVIPTASTSVIMTPELMVKMLPGILQKSSDWTVVGNVSTMYTNNYSALPAPKANGDGYFYTLVRNSQDALDDERLIDAVPTSLTLSVGPTDNEGILMSAWEFASSTYEREVTVSGTVTHAALTSMFKWGDIVNVSYGSNNLTSDFISAEFTVTNGAKLAQDLPSGEYVFPSWSVTATVKVIANAYTEGLKDLVLDTAVASGDTLKVAFGTSATTPAALGDLILTSFSYLTGWSSDYAEGEVIDLTFEGVFGGAGEYPFKSVFYHSVV